MSVVSSIWIAFPLDTPVDSVELPFCTLFSNFFNLKDVRDAKPGGTERFSAFSGSLLERFVLISSLKPQRTAGINLSD